METVLLCRSSPEQKKQIVSLIRVSVDSLILVPRAENACDRGRLQRRDHDNCCTRGSGPQGTRLYHLTSRRTGGRKLKRLLYRRVQVPQKTNTLLRHSESPQNSTLIYFNFYKNTILTLPLFWFGSQDNFSGQFFYDPYIFQVQSPNLGF